MRVEIIKEFLIEPEEIRIGKIMEFSSENRPNSTCARFCITTYGNGKLLIIIIPDESRISEYIGDEIWQ